MKIHGIDEVIQSLPKQDRMEVSNTSNVIVTETNSKNKVIPTISKHQQSIINQSASIHSISSSPYSIPFQMDRQSMQFQ